MRTGPNPQYDSEAEAQVWRELRRRLARAGVRSVDLDDATQDAWVRYDSMMRRGTYPERAAQILAVRYEMQDRRRAAAHNRVDLVDEVPDRAEDVDLESSLVIQEFLNLLPDFSERQVVFSYAVAALPHSKAAAVLGVSEDAAKMRYKRAKDKLKDLRSSKAILVMLILLLVGSVVVSVIKVANNATLVPTIPPERPTPTATATARGEVATPPAPTPTALPAVPRQTTRPLASPGTQQAREDCRPGLVAGLGAQCSAVINTGRNRLPELTLPTCLPIQVFDTQDDQGGGDGSAADIAPAPLEATVEQNEVLKVSQSFVRADDRGIERDVGLGREYEFTPAVVFYPVANDTANVQPGYIFFLDKRPARYQLRGGEEAPFSGSVPLAKCTDDRKVGEKLPPQNYRVWIVPFAADLIGDKSAALSSSPYSKTITVGSV